MKPLLETVPSKPPLGRLFSLDDVNLHIARKIRRVLTMLQDERVRLLEKSDYTTGNIKTVDITKNFFSGLAVILSGLTAVLIGTSNSGVSAIVASTISGCTNLLNTSLTQFVKTHKWQQRVVGANSSIQRLDILIRACSELKPDNHALKTLDFIQREYNVISGRIGLESIVILADNESGSSEEKD